MGHLSQASLGCSLAIEHLEGKHSECPIFDVGHRDPHLLPQERAKFILRISSIEGSLTYET